MRESLPEVRALRCLEVPVVGLVVGQHLCAAIELPACGAILEGSILEHVGGARLSAERAGGCESCGSAQKGEGRGKLHGLWLWKDDCVMIWNVIFLR